LTTTLLAFTSELVAKLTGLSVQRLYDWDRTGFYTPEYADRDRSNAYSRVYSFRDVVSLRTLSVLRDQHRVSHQELRRVSNWLKQHYVNPWSERDHDFKTLSGRRGSESLQVITFRCSEVDGRERAEKAIEFIEREYAAAVSTGRPLRIEITRTRMIVDD